MFFLSFDRSNPALPDGWQNVFAEALIYSVLFLALICGNRLLPHIFPAVFSRNDSRKPARSSKVSGKGGRAARHSETAPQKSSQRRRQDALDAILGGAPISAYVFTDFAAADVSWVMKQVEKTMPDRCKAAADALVGAGLSLDAVAYATVLANVEADQVEPLLQRRREYGEADSHADLMFYTALIRGCARVGRPGHAVKVFECMVQKAGVCPDSVCCNSVLHACAEQGLVEAAQAVLTKMRDLSLAPTTVTYNSLLHCCAKTGDGRRAQDLLANMELDGVRADIITYNTAITALAKIGAVDEAVAVLATMREAGVNPDVVSFNSVLSACSHAGAWRRALEMLDQLERSGVEPDVVSFNTVMNACDKAGHTDEADGLFSRMEALKIVPTRVTYNILIRSCCRRKAWEDAVMALLTMRKQGCPPDVVSFNTIISGCAGSGATRRAVEILKVEMPAAGVKPDHFSFSATLAGCAKEHLNDDARALVELFRESKVYADAVLYKTVIATCERLELWAEAVDLFEEAKRARAVSPELYTLLVRASVRRGDAALARSIYSDMVRRGYHPSPSLTNLVK
jgi:pentatricopeptide repeat domain-containing protein 1